MEVDLPPAVIRELIGLGPDSLEPGQEFEERIARLRNQYRIARVTEQLEEPAVRLAGTRGQHEMVWIDAGAAPFEFTGHCLSCRTESLRVWLIRQSRRRGQRFEQVGRVRQLHLRRIRCAEI